MLRWLRHPLTVLLRLLACIRLRAIAKAERQKLRITWPDNVWTGIHPDSPDQVTVIFDPKTPRERWVVLPPHAANGLAEMLQTKALQVLFETERIGYAKQQDVA